MFTRSVSLCILLLVFSLAAAQQPVSQNRYETMLERVKKMDRTVDFKELRLAFTETAAYSPYGGDRDARQAMFAAVNASEFDKALKNAEAILAKNYVDINAHFGSFVGYRGLGNAEKAAYHRFVFEGLVNSIKSSGDGKTMDTAFVVISTDEEYALLNWLGLRPAGQSLVHANGHDYDQMKVLDPKTDTTIAYFFNIDKPFKWLGNSLKK